MLQTLENTSLDLIGQQIMSYVDQLNEQRDNLIKHNDLLKEEIQLQKQHMGIFVFFFKIQSLHFPKFRTSRITRHRKSKVATTIAR